MQKKKAFTLIEVMVVMAIIAVLAVLIIGAITLARRTSTETTHRSNAKTMQTALEAVYTKDKMYCGGTTGPTCTDTAANFVGARTGTPTLSTTSCAAVGGGGTACAVRFLGNGVCIQAIAAQSYTITVYSYDCLTVVDTYQIQ